MNPPNKLVIPCKKKTCCPRLEITNPGEPSERFDLIDDDDQVYSMSRAKFLAVVSRHRLYFQDCKDAGNEPNQSGILLLGKVRLTLEQWTGLVESYFERQNINNQGLEEKLWEWNKSV
jgi:hypothetical protein